MRLRSSHIAKDKILQLRDLPLIHDHIAAIAVCKFGTIFLDMKPGMDYVQHSSNVTGAYKFSWDRVLRRIGNFLSNTVLPMKATCASIGVNFYMVLVVKVIVTIERLKAS